MHDLISKGVVELLETERQWTIYDENMSSARFEPLTFCPARVLTKYPRLYVNADRDVLMYKKTFIISLHMIRMNRRATVYDCIKSMQNSE